MDIQGIFNEYNEKLITSLPMKDVIFIAKLNSKRLFHGNLKNEVREKVSAADAADHFLNNTIEKDLQSDRCESFNKLLSAMEEFDNNSLKLLANEIKNRMKKEASTVIVHTESEVVSTASEMSSLTSVTGKETRESKSFDEMVSEVFSMFDKFSDEVNSQCVPSVEDTDIITEIKNPKMYYLISAQNYLQRSVAIMIKSAMSRLYGTKTVLSRLQDIFLAIQDLPKSSKARSTMTDKLDVTIQKHCKFQKADSIDPNKDWLWHSKEILQHSTEDVQKEMAILSEDLRTWNLCTCFKLMKLAKHDGNVLFESEHICHIFDVSEHLNFKLLAREAADTQICFASVPSSQMGEECEKQLKILEDLAHLVLCWIEKKDTNKNNIKCCKENYQAIKLYRKKCLSDLMVDWNSVLQGVENLNFNKYGYILINTPCHNNEKVDILNKNLSKLSIIPWIAIVDFDTNSEKSGLFSSLTEKDECKLKDSALFPGKRIVDVYNKNIKHASQKRACHIPWIFPHGEEQNETDKACPHHDRNLYCQQVRLPLRDTMRDIATSSCEMHQKVITVVFCYGNYADRREGDYFLDDLKYLCNNLQDDGGKVIVLSDSPSLKEQFKPLHVYCFPLLNFCNDVYSYLSIGECDLDPIKVPSGPGLIEVDFIEDDLELVHVHVYEHSMHSCQIRKNLERLSHKKRIDPDLIRNEIYDEVQENFYKGQAVTWISLKRGHIIERSEERKITNSITKMLDYHVSKQTEPSKYTLHHAAGAGASTLARKVLFNLKEQYPCVILKPNYIPSDEKVKHTVKSLKDLFDVTDRPILMLIDEEPITNTLSKLTHQVQTDGVPVVFLYVQRLDMESKQTFKGCKNSLVLDQKLHPDNIKELTDLLIKLFGKEKFSTRKHNLEILESMMSVPKENDYVTDLNFICNGKILVVTKIIDKMHFYYELKVEWEDKTKEKCYLSTLEDHVVKTLKRVYLKAEIAKLLTSHFYKTFQFYGLIYLDAEYHDQMHEHIITCLKSVDLIKLQILADLSVFFAFKVCESIHIKAFQNLCYSLKGRSKNTEFKLEDYISLELSQFLIVTTEGRFRITHPFVAEKIMKYYLTKDSKDADCIAKFFCDFLMYMCPTKFSHVNEVTQALINRLLYYREHTNDGDKFVKKQPFSPLILYVEKHYSQNASKTILEFAASLINNSHSHGHYARYLSTVDGEFDNALKSLNQAEECCSDAGEKAMVCNMKGDILRKGLEDYLLQNNTINWECKHNEAFKYHHDACYYYHLSHSYNSKVDHPLFGELTVRLLLLEKMKEENPKTFFSVVTTCDDLEVANSIGACHHLLTKLDEFLNSGEGGKDADSYEKSIKSQNLRLCMITDSEKLYKGVLLDSITNCKDNMRQAHFKRSYVNYCAIYCKSCTSETDLVYLKGMTEENLKCLSYDDRDMKHWLLIIRNLPEVATNMEEIKDKLVLWQKSATFSRVNPQSNDLLASFYLMIYNFIQLVEAGKDESCSNYVTQVKHFSQKTNKQSRDDKTRIRVKEWLHKKGKGFERLKSGRQNIEEMLPLTGSVMYATKEDARRYNSNTHISWKGVSIYFAPWKCVDKFNKNDKVVFTVGFSFCGPRAISCHLSKDHVSAGPFSTQAPLGTYKQQRKNV